MEIIEHSSRHIQLNVFGLARAKCWLANAHACRLERSFYGWRLLSILKVLSHDRRYRFHISLEIGEVESERVFDVEGKTLLCHVLTQKVVFVQACGCQVVCFSRGTDGRSTPTKPVKLTLVPKYD